jgi:hypothetical protein
VPHHLSRRKLGAIRECRDGNRRFAGVRQIGATARALRLQEAHAVKGLLIRALRTAYVASVALRELLMGG